MTRRKKEQKKRRRKKKNDCRRQTEGYLQGIPLQEVVTRQSVSVAAKHRHHTVPGSDIPSPTAAVLAPVVVVDVVVMDVVVVVVETAASAGCSSFLEVLAAAQVAGVEETSAPAAPG
jgi:hypothetical protein